jgi:hypothetical protein
VREGVVEQVQEADGDELDDQCFAAKQIVKGVADGTGEIQPARAQPNEYLAEVEALLPLPESDSDGGQTQSDRSIELMPGGDPSPGNAQADKVGDPQEDQAGPHSRQNDAAKAHLGIDREIRRRRNFRSRW